jgi:hypothetical protein
LYTNDKRAAEATLLKPDRSSFVPFGILDVQQRAVIGTCDLHSHDSLVTGHELISDHLQVRFALRDDVLLGADLQ